MMPQNRAGIQGDPGVGIQGQGIAARSFLARRGKKEDVNVIMTAIAKITAKRPWNMRNGNVIKMPKSRLAAVTEMHCHSHSRTGCSLTEKRQPGAPHRTIDSPHSPPVKTTSIHSCKLPIVTSRKYPTTQRRQHLNYSER